MNTIKKIAASHYFLLALLIIAGFAAYTFNLSNPLFWDDEDWIISNSFVHKISWENLKFIFSHDTLAGIGLRSNYFRPFLFLTFAFNYVLGGIKPLGYHLANNGLHIANGVLIFLVLFGILKKKLPAFLAALLFLIHPLQTEAVAYVSGRGDPLSVFFMLLALWFFARFKDKNIVLGYALSSVSVILGILSRETAFLFPLYFLIFSAAFFQKEKFAAALKKSIIRAWPFWTISLVYGILRLTILNFQNTLNFYREANFYTEHLSYRIFTFFHALTAYFRLIFVPAGLHMERDIVVNTSVLQWPVWLGVAIVGFIIWGGLVFYKKEKTQNQGQNWKLETENWKLPKISSFRLWFFAWGIFFVNLAPTSGIFPINALIYEHWLYFSLFGFFTLVAFYLDKLLHLLQTKRVLLFAAWFLLLSGYLVFFGFQTVRRNIIWGRTEEFYKNILRHEPQNVRALNNLAMYYSNQGKTKEAEELYWLAVDANNSVPAPYYNLGNILRDRGDVAGALELYKKAVERDPYFVYGYMNMASIYADQGKLVEATKMLEKVKTLKPYESRVYYNLSLIYLARGDRKSALDNLLMAEKLSESDPEANSAVKALLKQLERTDIKK